MPALSAKLSFGSLIVLQGRYSITHGKHNACRLMIQNPGAIYPTDGWQHISQCFPMRYVLYGALYGENAQRSRSRSHSSSHSLRRKRAAAVYGALKKRSRASPGSSIPVLRARCSSSQ